MLLRGCGLSRNVLLPDGKFVAVVSNLWRGSVVVVREFRGRILGSAFGSRIGVLALLLQSVAMRSAL